MLSRNIIDSRYRIYVKFLMDGKVDIFLWKVKEADLF